MSAAYDLLMMWLTLVGGYVTLNWCMNSFCGEQYTPYGNRLGLFGRLTYGWLWTDDPRYGEIDYELELSGQ